jgi:hypothetical protein
MAPHSRITSPPSADQLNARRAAFGRSIDPPLLPRSNSGGLPSKNPTASGCRNPTSPQGQGASARRKAQGFLKNPLRCLHPCAFVPCAPQAFLARKLAPYLASHTYFPRAPIRRLRASALIILDMVAL